MLLASEVLADSIIHVRGAFRCTVNVIIEGTFRGQVDLGVDWAGEDVDYSLVFAGGLDEVGVTNTAVNIDQPGVGGGRF